MKNPQWDLEEAILLINLGIRCETEKFDNKTRDEELKKLSDFLRHRADVIGLQHDDTFRNYAGIRKQYFFVYFQLLHIVKKEHHQAVLALLIFKL